MIYSIWVWQTEIWKLFNMPPKFVRNPGGSDYSHARRDEKASLLDADSDDEDFFLTGPRSIKPGGSRSDPKIDRLQNQVDEVVGVMQNNVSKVMERGDRLEDLQDQSDNLAGNADMFRSRARGLHKKMWWNNCKMKLALVVIILIVLLVIIIPIIVKSRNWDRRRWCFQRIKELSARLQIWKPLDVFLASCRIF